MDVIEIIQNDNVFRDSSDTDEDCEMVKNVLKKKSEPIISKDDYEGIMNTLNKPEKTSDDLLILNRQLESILKQLWTSKELTNFLFHTPRKLQDKIEAGAKELESIFKMIKETTRNIETIKLQVKAISKEKLNTQNSLRKKSSEEKLDLEMIVSIYDKVMYERWTNIKNSRSETLLENFVHEVEGRRQAMLYLKKLASEKLYKMKKARFSEKKNNLNKEEDSKSIEIGQRQIPRLMELERGSDVSIVSQISQDESIEEYSMDESTF
uniref:Uncharacterized protein n=1 Tax=Clastoptera arizonana TaxID=38151 RepID=A0A1B6CE86_9HEMI